MLTFGTRDFVFMPAPICKTPMRDGNRWLSFIKIVKIEQFHRKAQIGVRYQYFTVASVAFY